MTSEKAFFHYLRKNSQSLYHIAKENKKEKKILAQAITEKDKNKSAREVFRTSTCFKKRKQNI